MVGFIGVGRMGSAMAVNLARSGYRVIFFDPMASDVDELLATGATRATSLDDLENSTISFSMLRDGQTTHDVLLGDDGLVEHVKPGHLHVAMGTIGTTAARSLDAEAAARGLSFADAPVSGGVSTASTAQISCMVGASAADFSRIQPLLATMTRSQTLLGPPGAGSAMKLAVNLVLAQVNQALAEGLVLAERSGISRALAADALDASVIGSTYASYKREVYLDPEHAPVAAPMWILEKDLQLALAESNALGLILPGAVTTRAELTRAVVAGLADADVGRVISLVDVPAGGPTSETRSA